MTPYAADYDLAVLAFPLAWMAQVGLRDGWTRGDRNLLVVAWILPWITAPVAVLTHVSVVPVMMGLLLRQLWIRTQDPDHFGSATHSVSGGR